MPLDQDNLAQPSWSPDSRQIAYHRTTDQKGGYATPIRGWIVDADGSGLHELATPAGEDAADLDWSPDGSLIVYSNVDFRESEGVGNIDPPSTYTIRPDATDARFL